ncbi:MAG TPA: hypothetical protein VFL47_16855, partial [Flavisolibacter sp.]|nr:hypothetical protein [Flavisolibacter sp.]
MSTKKKNSNGALNAPVATVFDGLPVSEEADAVSVKKTAAKSKKAKAEELLDDEIDRRELLRVLSEVKNGNFSARMAVDKVGISGKICDTLNEIIALNETLISEINQARSIIGKQGKLNHRVEMPRMARGSWSAASESINSLISDLVHPTI